MANSLTSNGSADDTKTPRQLLPLFYKQYGLDDDGGQNSRYVKIEFTPRIFIYFPNFDERRRAVLKHDIHHITTGYTSTFKGETEIGAWEIGSNCLRYWAALFLNLHAMAIGILFNPVGVYKAFVRGRRTKNLYADMFSDEAVMDMPVYQLKEELLLNKYPAPQKGNAADFVLFLLVLLPASVYSVLSLVFLPFVLLYTLYIMVTK